MLFLGEAIDRQGSISPREVGRLADAVAELAAAAAALSAPEPLLLGTEPLRRTDPAPVAEALKEATGLGLEVLSAEEEGLLTLLGVTGGRRAAGELLVVDIGGGSTEVTRAGAANPVAVSTLALGSARLVAELAHADPPSQAGMDTLREAARRAVAGLGDPLPGGPVSMVLVGGSATNLARLATGRTEALLGATELRLAEGLLLGSPSSELALRHGLHPRRARVLPAGLAILEAIMAWVGVEQATVSDASLRDGAILARAIAGAGWRASLPSLVRGMEPPGPVAG
jgi:exopolyphosphatase/guanosine-5'-triphosphate,3'-diphosphate pyrophosphatase